MPNQVKGQVTLTPSGDMGEVRFINPNGEMESVMVKGMRELMRVVSSSKEIGIIHATTDKGMDGRNARQGTIIARLTNHVLFHHGLVTERPAECSPNTVLDAVKRMKEAMGIGE